MYVSVVSWVDREKKKEPRKIYYLWRVEYISYRQMESVHCFNETKNKCRINGIALKIAPYFMVLGFFLFWLYYKFISTDIRKTIFQKKKYERKKTQNVSNRTAEEQELPKLSRNVIAFWCLFGSKPQVHTTIIHHKFPIWAIFSHSSGVQWRCTTATYRLLLKPRRQRQRHSSSRTATLCYQLYVFECACVCSYFTACIRFQNATSEWHITEIISAISRYACVRFIFLGSIFKAHVLSVVHGTFVCVCLCYSSPEIRDLELILRSIIALWVEK